MQLTLKSSIDEVMQYLKLQGRTPETIFKSDGTHGIRWIFLWKSKVTKIGRH